MHGEPCQIHRYQSSLLHLCMRFGSAASQSGMHDEEGLPPLMGRAPPKKPVHWQSSHHAAALGLNTKTSITAITAMTIATIPRVDPASEPASPVSPLGPAAPAKDTVENGNRLAIKDKKGPFQLLRSAFFSCHACPSFSFVALFGDSPGFTIS